MISVHDFSDVATTLRGHPCLSANSTGGRIHLPVSPGCNIQCRFCARRTHPTMVAPGVACRVLSPSQAADRVDLALQKFPDITVAGIAGPGDPLATDHAARTFALIHERHPDLILCMSTNGLELAAQADSLWKLGVRSVTVTLNALNPEILSRIVPRIAIEQRVVVGEEAARVLVARQLDGIAKAASLGAFVKINFVLVPGLNDGEAGEVARVAASLGARRINIIPLLPQAEFIDHRPPSCSDLEEARRAAERHLAVFRHCQRCRADACGIPGRREIDPSELGDSRSWEGTFSHG